MSFDLLIAAIALKLIENHWIESPSKTVNFSQKNRRLFLQQNILPPQNILGTMKLFFSDQDIDEEHFHFWNHGRISKIKENIAHRRTPPPPKPPFGGGVLTCYITKIPGMSPDGNAIFGQKMTKKEKKHKIFKNTKMMSRCLLLPLWCQKWMKHNLIMFLRS